MGAANRSGRSVPFFVAGCFLAVLGCQGQIRAAPFDDALLLSMHFDDDAEMASPESGSDRMVFDTGIKGRALDMVHSTNVSPIAAADTAWFSRDRSFSVAVWVNSREVTEDPTILLSNADFSKRPNGIYGDRRTGNGWTLYSQGGAWGWNIGNGAVHYLYTPLAEDQPIADDQWHLLAFTYDATRREARLYYDGINRAVLRLGDMDKRDFVGPYPLSLGPSQPNRSLLKTFPGRLDELNVWGTALPPDAIKAQYSKYLPGRREPQLVGDTITVLNWNIWHGGTHYSLEQDGFDGIDRTIELIQRADADIVLMQETYGAGSRISSSLGYYYYEAASTIGAVWGANLSVMSRFPMDEAYMVESPSNYGNNYAFNNGGVKIRLGKGRSVLAFTNWYNGRKPEDLEGALTAWNSLLRDAHDVPLIWGGDFNSVSHLDDGEGASGHSKLMTRAGFIDAYRTAHPDVRAFAGYSNPGNSARIDYVYSKGEKLTLLEAGPLVPDFRGRGETPGYPSDHLGIVAKFTIR